MNTTDATDGIHLLPLRGIGDVQPGDDLPGLILAALARQGHRLAAGDVLVVTQKIISKAEGRLVNTAEITPSAFAHTLAAQGHKPAAYYEVVLRESRRIVRMQNGVLITETPHGFVCANGGVDDSNVPGSQILALLPKDPDASAAALRTALADQTGVAVGVVISDTFGRPWRMGQVNVAIGVAGFDPLLDYAGNTDPYGYQLQASLLAVGDELASAAELVMNKIDQVPAALIRGYRLAPPVDPGRATARTLVRDAQTDLFR